MEDIAVTSFGRDRLIQIARDTIKAARALPVLEKRLKNLEKRLQSSTNHDRVYWAEEVRKTKSLIAQTKKSSATAEGVLVVG
ncbi:hypothetical protein, partial [Salmonella enterica]|uniref:hypothetical protein n=1 Tax=Salmonella enterica TaxID=28901 RepID=UPI0039E9D9FB